MFVSKYFKAKITQQKVDENVISSFRNQLKLKFFLYKRKKARWLTLVDDVEALSVQPIKFSDQYLQRKIDVSFESEGLPELALKLKERNATYTLFIKTLALAAALWSLALISNETALIFVPRDGVSAILNKSASNVWITFPFTMVVETAMISTAFFTIFKLKLSDYLQLVPGHTDIITLCQFSGYFSQLVTVACFNYMVMADQLNS